MLAVIHLEIEIHAPLAVRLRLVLVRLYLDAARAQVQILDAGTDAHDLPGTVNRMNREREHVVMVDPCIEP